LKQQITTLFLTQDVISIYDVKNLQDMSMEEAKLHFAEFAFSSRAHDNWIKLFLTVSGNTTKVVEQAELALLIQYSQVQSASLIAMKKNVAQLLSLESASKSAINF